MKKFFIYTVLLVSLIGLAAGGYIYYQFERFLKQPVFTAESTAFEIKKGSSYGDFVQTVKSNKGNGSVFNWKLMARFNRLENSIKAGEFEIDKPFTPLELVEYIANNNVKTYSITLIEGHNWAQIKQQLINSPISNAVLDMDDEQLIDYLNIEADHLEGQFLPETYQFTKGDEDIDILLRAHQALLVTLNQAWQERDKDLAIQSPYELLVLASIIEKETAEHSERDVVSGVFHRRLQKGMRLQTDPTVIYGVGEAYAGDITSAHLRTDTPYNTYTRKGLPPTPIAMPSAASIYAAAHPNKGKELYFVANNKGGHRFSETYEQHQKAVQAYLKGQ